MLVKYKKDKSNSRGLFTARVYGNSGPGYEQPANRHRWQQQTGGEGHVEEKILELMHYS